VLDASAPRACGTTYGVEGIDTCRDTRLTVLAGPVVYLIISRVLWRKYKLTCTISLDGISPIRLTEGSVGLKAATNCNPPSGASLVHRAKGRPVTLYGFELGREPDAREFVLKSGNATFRECWIVSVGTR
jgi:hypothetical protein